MHIMSGYSLLGDKPFSQSDVGVITYWLTSHGKLWMFVSAGCILLLAFVFLLLAAWKVNPMNSGSGRLSRKKKKEN